MHVRATFTKALGRLTDNVDYIGKINAMAKASKARRGFLRYLADRV
jgi:hypothetical protein